MKLIHQNKEVGHILLKDKVGSHAYVTNVEGSDEDFKGIYMQDPIDVLNRGYQEQVEVSKDECYYEIRRFLELCSTGNPTMMELLWMPEDCIIYKHDIINVLIEHREKFISKSCKWSYGGYAIEQIKKAGGLQKKMNWEKEATVRKTILDFCYVYSKDQKVEPFKAWAKSMGFKQEFIGLTSLPHFRYMYNMYYDHVKSVHNDNPKFRKNSDFTFKGVVQDEETSQDVSLSEVPKWYNLVEGLLYVNKDEYSTHCRRYKEYLEWQAKKNVQRYVDVENHGQKIDGKNLLHCVRLINMGNEIAEGKGLIVRRPDAQYLIDIRKGKFDLKTILDKAEKDIESMNEKFDNSSLQDKVNRGFFLELLPKLRKRFYQREGLNRSSILENVLYRPLTPDECYKP